MHILLTAVAIVVPSLAVITKLGQLEHGRRLRRRLAEWNSYDAEQQRRRALETNAHTALECGVFDVVTLDPECDPHEAEQETVVAA
jgi:hypothetical protein